MFCAPKTSRGMNVKQHFAIAFVCPWSDRGIACNKELSERNSHRISSNVPPQKARTFAALRRSRCYRLLHILTLHTLSREGRVLLALFYCRTESTDESWSLRRSNPQISRRIGAPGAELDSRMRLPSWRRPLAVENFLRHGSYRARALRSIVRCPNQRRN